MNNQSFANFTHTTRDSPGDRENGRLTLEVSDLEYNLIWVGQITTFNILEQNPSMKDAKLKKTDILEMVEDILNKGFSGDKLVSLSVTTTETNQLTLKCEQKSPYVAFSLTLILASHKNFTGLVDDVREALKGVKGRQEASDKRVDELLVMINTLNARLSTQEQSRLANTPMIDAPPLPNISGGC
jgi:hypothetical protein